jgi:hypothetical protein
MVGVTHAMHLACDGRAARRSRIYNRIATPWICARSIYSARSRDARDAGGVLAELTERADAAVAAANSLREIKA